MKPVAPSYTGNLSPLGRISQVSAKQTQQALQGIFMQKGMPKFLRLDNGAPFANQRDRRLPTNLALWLVAIGVQPIFNPPGCPQKNGTVECMQRVSTNWINPNGCADLEQLRQELEKMARFHLHEYRVRRLGDRPRAEVFPELLQIHRPFDDNLIDPQRIREYLQQFAIERETSAKGIIGFACQEWTIGAKYSRQKVSLTFNPLLDCWEVKEKNGLLLRQLPKLDLSIKAIEELTVLSMNVADSSQL